MYHETFLPSNYIPSNKIIKLFSYNSLGNLFKLQEIPVKYQLFSIQINEKDNQRFPNQCICQIKNQYELFDP